MKIKKTVKFTTSRSEFNYAYKEYLERKGKIHCSRCSYHRGENDERKWYGNVNDKHIRFPNWKLVSKNSKQWMKKPMKIIKKIKHNYINIEIKF